MISLNQLDNKSTTGMKKVKYITGLIVCFCIGYFLAAYTRPVFLSPVPLASEITSTPSQDNEQKPQYVVDIPAKYFDPQQAVTFDFAGTIMLAGIDFSPPPVAIDRRTEIKAIDEEFKLGESSTYLDNSSFDPVDIDNDGEKEEYSLSYGKPIDVNNDGEKEKVLYGSVAMTHSPHKAIIIKNGRIIYKSKDHGRIGIGESKSHNGFYLYEEFDIGAFPYGAGYRVTRFIHEDGKFIPVWYRERFNLQTTKP